MKPKADSLKQWIDNPLAKWPGKKEQQLPMSEMRGIITTVL